MLASQIFNDCRAPYFLRNDRLPLMSEGEQKIWIQISWIAEMHFWVLVVYIKQIIKRTDAQQLAYGKEQMIYSGRKTNEEAKIGKRRNEMKRGREVYMAT